MAKDRIIVRGAREHNLKNIDVDLPRDKFIVITGLSGSGKSSLAFDTIYAEGQRRYVESLSAYARQFLGQMDKPDVDYIEGLSPAISIDQKTSSRNPRSTVGTVTEIYDYLRLLYARIGKPHCHQCSRPISRQTVDQMVDQILSLDDGTRIQVLAPIVRGRKGEYGKLFTDLQRSGYIRVRVDDKLMMLDDDITLDKQKKHTIEVVIDRLVIKSDISTRLADSLERAIELTGGLVSLDLVDTNKELLFSQHLACPDCGVSMEELVPRMFSFNSPYGACPDCHGLGQKLEIDPDLVIHNRSLSLTEGAVEPWSSGSSTYYTQLLSAVAQTYGFSMDEPVANLTKEQLEIILYGSKDKISFTYKNRYGRRRKWQVRFEGVIPNLERRHRESTSDSAREQIESYMVSTPCPGCKGTRLRPESLAVLINGNSIADVTSMTAERALEFISTIELTDRERQIGNQILKELTARLGFMVDVGLDYLALNRSAGTLAGGEAQRIRLATQIGSNLVGVLYILDEPSIGLHQRDNAKLIATLKRLRDRGNTVIVVEHDEETILECDHVIDIGPGAGRNGGKIVAQGSPDEVMSDGKSLTGRYLSGVDCIPVPETRRAPNSRVLTICGAKEHNLKNIDVTIPLGTFVCVTGVSGSGKSTLINDILYQQLASKLHGARLKAGAHDTITGLDLVDKVINIDQSPIGRTPRSNPATYTGVFDHIREVFSQTPESRTRGYRPGRFSFNVRGGRCEACRGDGTLKIEMHFLPDVYVKCDVCHGSRYNRETLEINYRGKTIADVLDMNVDEALSFFENIPRIERKLSTLHDVGLGYIRLGQSATTLSGGEAQRVKLATQLSKRSNGKTLYLLDEPTTGLHPADIHKLLQVLQRLVDAGDTVCVIEHNLDVIKTADWIIDLGPEGGDGGGKVIATGSPEQLATAKGSYTGHYISMILDRAKRKLADKGGTSGVQST